MRNNETRDVHSERLYELIIVVSYVCVLACAIALSL